MPPRDSVIEDLLTLNRISETLNKAADVHSVLDQALAQLIELTGLETGWIFLTEATAKDQLWGRGYVLAAHHNLPPALALDNSTAWMTGCDCQKLCEEGCLDAAYNEVHCSRLSNVSGDTHGLVVHASAPLRSGDQTLGILNVAGPDWDAFSPRTLALLSNVGSQMGIALERARLYDLVQDQRIHEHLALLDLSGQLLSRRDLRDLMSYLVEKVRELLQVDACALLLPYEEPGYLAFQAASGWRVDPIANLRLVPTDERSGAGMVMRTQQPLLDEDIQKDSKSPWLTDWILAEGFRGHAVVPLIAEGRSIGALVIDSHTPRRLQEQELRFLRLMANQAAIAIEQIRLHQEELARQALEEDLAVGRKIQRSLLPKSWPSVPGWEFAALSEAARLVGGDFYDFFELPGSPGQLGIVIADVADKGVPAALFMALSRTTIRATALSGRSPASTLQRANTLILNDSRSDLFLTAFYATLDTRTGQLKYASAGHNHPYWFRIDRGTSEELSARGIILGALEDIALEEREFEIAPGDLLILYTDGVTEAQDARGQLFGNGRLRAIISANRHAGAERILEAIVDAIRAFVGDTPQSDDFTLVIVKRLAV